MIPDLPRCSTACVNVIEHLLVLKCIHGRPEALVLVCEKLPLLNQSLKRLMKQLFAAFHVLKNILAKDEVATVDPNVGATYVFDRRHDTCRVQRDEMTGQVGLHTEKTRHFLITLEMVNLFIERQVSKAVAIISEEHLFTIEVFLHCFKTLPNIRPCARIGKSDIPIIDITIEKLQILAALGQNKVIIDAFVVIEEVVLDEICGVTKAKDKVL